MTLRTQRSGAGNDVERPARDEPGGLADVIELILGKGLRVADYVPNSSVGVEIPTVDAEVSPAGVGAYLRFAEAVGRLNLAVPDDLAGLAAGGRPWSCRTVPAAGTVGGHTGPMSAQRSA